MTIPASAPLDPPDPVAAVARRRRLRPVTPVPWRRPLALTGVAVIGAWVVIAIFAPLIAPYGFADSSSGGVDFPKQAPPSGSHLFGTTVQSTDVLLATDEGELRVFLPDIPR